MSTSHVPAFSESPRFVFFTDFDGTITTDDCNDYLVDNLGFGPERRQQLYKEVMANRMSFRDSFLEMFDSITTPYNECLDLLRQNIKLDPGFKGFYDWARENHIPIVILSSGTVPMIRTLLDSLLGSGWDIQIIGNNVVPRDGKSIDEKGGWRIDFHDESHHGHDKSLEIRKYSLLSGRPILFYAGDGVSDLSAAKETDLLFAKADKELVVWCEREGVPFVAFRDWNSILETCKKISAGLITVEEAANSRI
ncbi:putative phosphatase [Metarhizium anisopliae]|nr:putative phosphatase [Metarhizium anisopliae]